MSTVRCPKCKLINSENASKCRRCGASLAPAATGPKYGSAPKPPQSKRNLLVAGIVAALALVIFVIVIYSKKSADPKATADTANKVVLKSTSANPELDEVKKIHQDFLAQLDQNMAAGEGFKKNQTLAYDTLMLVQKEQMKLTDAAAQKHLAEFNRRVNKYYDQLAQYNTETDQFKELNLQTAKDLENIQQDSSLSEQEKSAKNRELRYSTFSKGLDRSINSMDLEETAKSLHELLNAPSAP